jgi:hypothetical protein
VKTEKQSLVDERLISVTELADRWGIDRHTVVRLLDEAGIMAIYLSGKAYGTRRYAARDIDQFLQCRQAAARPLAEGQTTRRRLGIRRRSSASRVDGTPRTPPVLQG